MVYSHIVDSHTVYSHLVCINGMVCSVTRESDAIMRKANSMQIISAISILQNSALCNIEIVTEERTLVRRYL